MIRLYRAVRRAAADDPSAMTLALLGGFVLLVPAVAAVRLVSPLAAYLLGAAYLLAIATVAAWPAVSAVRRSLAAPPRGTLIPVGHCPGCTCDLLVRGVVLVEVSGELLAEMRDRGWSAPMQVQIKPIEGTGRWEMTCRTVPVGVEEPY